MVKYFHILQTKTYTKINNVTKWTLLWRNRSCSTNSI